MQLMMTTIAVGTLAVAGAAGGVIAAADPGSDPSVQPVGTQGTIIEGPVTEGWTISDLEPSPDTVAYQPRGALWEATATAEAIHGSFIPVIMNFGAQSPSGQVYPVLFALGTPQGLSPFPIEEGQRTTGKIYFDITGDAPDAVVYQPGGQNPLTWVSNTPKPPQPRAHPGGGSGSAPPAPPRSTPPRQIPKRPPPVNSQGTPLPPGAPEVPAPAPRAGGTGGRG